MEEGWEVVELVDLVTYQGGVTSSKGSCHWPSRPGDWRLGIRCSTPPCKQTGGGHFGLEFGTLKFEGTF